MRVQGPSPDLTLRVTFESVLIVVLLSGQCSTTKTYMSEKYTHTHTQAHYPCSGFIITLTDKSRL